MMDYLIQGATLEASADKIRKYLAMSKYEFKPEVIGANGRLVQDSVTVYYRAFVDNDGNYDGVTDNVGGDIPIAYTYLLDNEGRITPVLYDTDPNGYSDTPDTDEPFFYIGLGLVDEEFYDVWRKIESQIDGTYTWDSVAKQYIYTNRIVRASGGINPTDFPAKIDEVVATRQPNLQNKTVTPSSVQQTITADSGYGGLGSVVIEGDTDLNSANIKSGANIFGVSGSSTVVDTSTSKPVIGDYMSNGYEAYVNGEKVIGNMSPSNGNLSLNPSDFYASSGTLYMPYNHLNAYKSFCVPSGSMLLQAPLTENCFGDATETDVAAGKTFTSSAGLKKIGTAVIDNVTCTVTIRAKNAVGLSNMEINVWYTDPIEYEVKQHQLRGSEKIFSVPKGTIIVCELLSSGSLIVSGDDVDALDFGTAHMCSVSSDCTILYV
jgi:hypothetical protein